MSRSRSNSLGDTLKEPHLITLKVLRLSRPTFQESHPLPHPEPHSLPDVETAPLHSSSLSYPSQPPTEFPLAPLVTLPPSFGNAYIGETFSCLLSANNSSPTTALTDVRLTAEMTTPSTTVPIELELPADMPASDVPVGGDTQRIARYELREEGNYVLAVTVTYTEASESGRTRTFRKLYQFVVQQCLTVRTKSSRIAGGAVLEAQLENMGEGSIVLNKVRMLPKDGWEVVPFSPCAGEILRSREVTQVGFKLTGEGSSVLGQLEIGWRTGGGGVGSLTTGVLSVKTK